MRNPFDLTGKVIVLTGAMGFLGKVFTQTLRDGGATVVATDIVEGADVLLDVRSQDSIRTAFATILNQHGRIDVVVNNAAYNPGVNDPDRPYERTFVDYSPELMGSTLGVNLVGPWMICQEAIRHFLTVRQGVIINIASVYGMVPPRQEIYPSGMEKPVDYSVTKAGVVMLTRHIASQFGRAGIRCNALAPGGVFKNQTQDFVAKYSAMTSLGRMSTPDEVACGLWFLASDASCGMTGEVLSVDCGIRSR